MPADAACHHRGMSDDDGRDRNPLEAFLRSIAEEVGRTVDKVSETDIDGLARTAGLDPDEARAWLDGAATWVREQLDQVANPFAERPADAPATAPAPDAAPARVPADDPLRGAGPSPLDVPTPEQGAALAALDSGRWTVEPGTAALAARGEGPGPSDALGLVRELRVRDWIGADGAVTVTGRHALKRWLEASARG